MKISFEQFRLYKSKNRNEDEVLLKIPSLCFESGNVNIIKSESGLGKTQLLNAICGQSKNYDGSIFVDGKVPVYDKSFFKLKCSYVTSDECCLSCLTIKDHFLIACKDYDKIDELAKKLKLASIINQKISKCSMGEKKRIEIGTAILKDSPILLLDEPTANLDETNSALIFEILEEYAIDHLVIVASHENDKLIGKCNIYKIENKEIAPIECQNQIDESQVKETGARETPKISPNVSLKIGLSKSLNNKISFVLGFLFCLLFFISTFFCFKLSTISESDTLSSAIDSSPYNYTRIKYNAEYVSDNDDLFSCTQASVSDLYGSLVNVACLEDLNGELQQEYQDVFDNFTSDYQSDSKTFYHPVILTVNQQAFFKSKQLVLNVGDVVPFTFSNCFYAVGHSNYSDIFVVAGIIDTNEEMSENYSLSNSFPLILKREDYISSLRHTGIRCNTINESVKSILAEYKEYCLANNIVYDLNDAEFNMNNLIPYSAYTGLYKKYSSEETIYENDGYVYYLGNLPENKNWIMVPNDNGSINALYSLLQTSDFFERYTTNDVISFPLVDNFQLLNYDSLNDFSIQGLYLVNDTSLVMKDCLIVSDSLFVDLLNSIESSSNNKDLVSSNISFAGKSWLKENMQSILSDQSIIFESESLVSLLKTFDNMIRVRSFSIILCVIISVLSLLFSLIYFIGVRNLFTKDFAVLTLLGISGFQKFMLLLVSISPLILISYILSLSVSELISDSLINAIAINSGFVGSIITLNPIVCYAIQLLSGLILLLLIFVLSELGKKKTYVADIKENK